MSRENYDSPAQQRILRALLVLAGNEFQGLAPGELAKALGVNPSTATRDLHNLREVGFAEQIQETGRWRLGPKPIQLSLAFSTALTRARSRLDEITNRYSREI
ncbi:helix-turn-helix domain-containing protein [Aromatoleum evansii]|uniref:helix-turn-helix domain-containing protein n=1 Tax=Aromatoleum evansii TaxID=59406 RepID=UPI00145E8844|nr:helix-turn-helix domain-containing protein [Aromatoleum evansii]NMG29332.1 helix-turn-helix domain-containing protein [Aromatoleum evansii]